MTFSNIVITGASSGIGAALAKYYARPGVSLGLVGRDQARLNAVAAEVRAAGAIVEGGLFDLRDRAALLNFLSGFDRTSPIDLLIANAGVLDGRRADGSIEHADMARRVIEINLLGAVDTLHAVLPAMRTRRSGHIVLVSSLAALSPLADAPGYSASKAGLLAYGQAMRERLLRRTMCVLAWCAPALSSAR